MTTYQFTVSLATSSTGGSNPGLITGSFTTSPPITTYLPPYTDGASGGTYTWCSNLFLVGCSHNTIYANTASASNGQFSDAVESYQTSLKVVDPGRPWLFRRTWEFRVTLAR